VTLKFQPPRVTIAITIKPFEERHFVTLAIFLLAVGMLMMAREEPKLWDVELFKILLQAVIVTGILNMILSFHYAANKGDEQRSQNTAKAFEAITAAATAATPADVSGAAVAAEQAATEGDTRR